MELTFTANPDGTSTITLTDKATGRRLLTSNTASTEGDSMNSVGAASGHAGWLVLQLRLPCLASNNGWCGAAPDRRRAAHQALWLIRPTGAPDAKLPLPPTALPHSSRTFSPHTPPTQFSGQTMHFIDGAPVTAAQAKELEAQLDAGSALLPTLLPLLVAVAAAAAALLL